MNVRAALAHLFFGRPSPPAPMARTSVRDPEALRAVHERQLEIDRRLRAFEAEAEIIRGDERDAGAAR